MGDATIYFRIESRKLTKMGALKEVMSRWNWISDDLVEDVNDGHTAFWEYEVSQGAIVNYYLTLSIAKLVVSSLRKLDEEHGQEYQYRIVQVTETTIVHTTTQVVDLIL